jgi:plastocyanin
MRSLTKRHSSTGDPMRHLRLILAAAAVAALACSGDDSPSAPTGGGATTVTVGTPSGGLVFNPTSINVPLNGTVTWNWNSGGVVHDVTFQDGSNSGPKSSGTFQKTFPTAGTFTYICSIHGPVMSGSVVVGSSSGGTGGTGGGSGGGGAYP